MKVIAFLNPENGTCAQTLSILYKLYKHGVEIEKVYLVLENTYHAEKWVISFAMPVSKEEIEGIKKTYIKKVLAEWEALSGNADLKVEAVVDEVKNLIKNLKMEDYDQIVLGCLEEKSLCKLLETLDKPALVVKN
jgi:diphthamide synthase (EF-2-diphthine--ammonia ligase)